MPFSIRPYSRFPVRCSCFAQLLLAIAVAGCATPVLLPDNTKSNEARNAVEPSLYTVQPKDFQVANAEGNLLTGWIFSEQGDRGTVLIGGGNAMSFSQVVHYNSFLLGNGFRVLVYSYQGFSQNEGAKNIRSLVSDAMAFHEQIATSFPGEPVVLMGESIGAATSLCLASYLPNPPAVMVESVIDPKTVGYSSAQRFWPLFFIGFPLALLVDVDVPASLDVRKCLHVLSSSTNPPPVLFVHNPNDLLAPYSTMKELLDEYEGPKQLIISHCNPGAKCHMNLYLAKDVRDKIIEFVKAYFFPLTGKGP